MAAEVPLSIFTAFVSAPTGAAQLAIVQEAKQKYDPRTDFYKALREATQRSIFTHDPTYVHRAAAKASPTRREQYLACAIGLDKWLKKTSYDFVERLSSIKYTCGDLTIIVTTEFLLKIGDDMALVKPFLRQDELTRDAKNAFSFLVGETHGKTHKAEPLLLIAREAKLRRGYPTKGAATIVRAEADKFVSMWRNNQVA
ncbi:MAG: hypothetical protein QOG04_2182 [Actinomycetota bacterium]|nr:hypothetical protein [Actinomycetota bacterium]